MPNQSTKGIINYNKPSKCFHQHITINYCHSMVYTTEKLKRLKVCVAIDRNPSQRYGASLVISDHIVLPATRHKWTHPAFTPASQASTWFTYPGWMELARLSWRSSLIAQPELGIKPTTVWLQVWRPNCYATKHPNQENGLWITS